MSLTVRNLGRHSDGYWTAEVAAENAGYTSMFIESVAHG